MERCDPCPLAIKGSMPEAGILCGWVVNGYSEKCVGQSYGEAEDEEVEPP
jgi:hypothetical protein